MSKKITAIKAWAGVDHDGFIWVGTITYRRDSCQEKVLKFKTAENGLTAKAITMTIRGRRK